MSFCESTKKKRKGKQIPDSHASIIIIYIKKVGMVVGPGRMKSETAVKVNYSVVEKETQTIQIQTDGVNYIIRPARVKPSLM